MPGTADIAVRQKSETFCLGEVGGAEFAGRNGKFENRIRLAPGLARRCSYGDFR
jgi:hypothetical protein